MSFLYPAMLAGLLGLSVPIILHLIAKHRFIVQDLPTIRFLDKQERTNVLALRLVDPWQLLLRLAVLLLAVLAMARWMTPSEQASAPRNVVLVVDTSPGMSSLAAAESAGNAAATQPSNATQPSSKDALAPASPRASLLDRAKSHAGTILDGLPAGSRAALVADRSEGPLDLAPTTELPTIRLSVNSLRTTDGVGRGLVRAVADACDMVRGRHEVRSQIIVLTDLRAASLASRDSDALRRIADARAAMGDTLDIVFVPVGVPAGEPVAVVDAKMRKDAVMVGQDAQVVATVLNSGTEPKRVKVELAVADRRQGTPREVTVEPGATAVVGLSARVNRAMQTVADASIPGENPAWDQKRGVPINVTGMRRLLIVQGGGDRITTASEPASPLSVSAPATMPAAESQSDTLDGSHILRFALNPGRELGQAIGTGVDTTLVTPDALAAQPLSKYELVVLYNVSALSDQAMADIRAFVSQGKALWIVVTAQTRATTYNRTLAAGTKDAPPLSPATLGNERDLDATATLRFVAPQHAALIPFADPKQGDLSVVRIHRVRDLAATTPGTTTLVSATTGHPLVLESPLGAGRVVLFTFGAELSESSLARTRAFPVFAWRLVDYLTGRLRQRPSDTLVAMRSAVLDVSDPSLALAEELELTPVSAATPGAATQSAQTAPADATPEAAAINANAPLRMKVNPDLTVLVPPLPAGRYQLHKARAAGDAGPVLGYSRYITVAPDAALADRRRASDAEVAGVFNGGARVLPPSKLASLRPSGAELTRWLIVALAAFYLAEAVIGWIVSVRRERDRGVESPRPTQGGAA